MTDCRERRTEVDRATHGAQADEQPAWTLKLSVPGPWDLALAGAAQDLCVRVSANAARVHGANSYIYYARRRHAEKRVCACGVAGTREHGHRRPRRLQSARR